MDTPKKIAKESVKASKILNVTSSQLKSNILKLAANKIKKNFKQIQNANKIDLKIAKSKGLNDALIDRLFLDKNRINGISQSLMEIVKWPDPVGKILNKWKRPNGLEIHKVSVPIGVLLIIYESRPNVTTDASGLCLKSGNAVILKCGSESLNSSKALLSCIHQSLKKYKLPENLVQILPSNNRKLVSDLLKMDNRFTKKINREDVINQGFSFEFTNKIFESKKNTIHENETSDNYYVVKVISDSEVKFNNERFNVVKKSVNKIYGIDNLQQITKILENKFPISVNKNLLNEFIDRLQY